LESESHQVYLALIPASDQNFQFPWMMGTLCLVILLLILSAIISGFESACFSLNTDQKAILEGMHKNRSGKVLQLLADPEKLMASIIISNSVIILVIIFLAAVLLSHFQAFLLTSLSGILFQILIITFTILIFGKILPKMYAHRHSIDFSLFAVYPVHFAQTFFYPLVFLLIWFNTKINHSLLPNRNSISMDDLSEALDNTDDVVTEDRKILMGIVNFGNIEVSDVMKPRMDVVALDVDTTFPVLIQIINDSGYSRIPVFTETFDNIKGILYVKDLLPFLGEKENFKWQELIRPGYYVPETKKIKDLLQEFLDKKIHLAIVVDEYGGTEGIVTLEDVLEEIVGEITDESDEVESFYSKIDDYNYVFDGKILLNDFLKIVKLSEDLFESIRGDADTLAGLILEIKGEIPPANETIKLKHFSFTILSVDDRRIKKLKFTIDKNFKTR
jgi:putative hemolysin